METIRMTRSVCPVCLRKLEAVLYQEADGSVTLNKTCPEHGSFSVPVWRGRLDFDRWTGNARPLGELGQHCPDCEGICAEHEIGSCCVLLEVTRRCNLRCRFCFADGGGHSSDPGLDELKASVDDIIRQRGSVLLQLSGGEPTLRDDLPELIRHAKAAGASTVQVNTNGLRLAADGDYVRALKDAGLDIVFLQFDGTEDEVYRVLRGRPLLAEKLRAIEACAAAGLGVTLVPTVVPSVNDALLGELVRFAAARVPAVRAVHFQPVSYFGRIPGLPEASERYTLDALMADIAAQAEIPTESFLPSRCDHPLCGFHASFLVRPDGGLRPLTAFRDPVRTRGSAADNRSYVARHWGRPEAAESAPAADFSDGMDFDSFLNAVRTRSLQLSAMAFQDAGNLNIERLHRCSLHVYDSGAVKPFCARYLTPMENAASILKE